VPNEFSLETLSKRPGLNLQSMWQTAEHCAGLAQHRDEKNNLLQNQSAVTVQGVCLQANFRYGDMRYRHIDGIDTGFGWFDVQLRHTRDTFCRLLHASCAWDLV
jgi:hypothetical protein